MLFTNLLGAAALVSTAFAAPSVMGRATNSTKLKWFGINESGAEFGEKNFTVCGAKMSMCLSGGC
jgi:endoglucanase